MSTEFTSVMQPSCDGLARVGIGIGIAEPAAITAALAFAWLTVLFFHLLWFRRNDLEVVVVTLAVCVYCISAIIFHWQGTTYFLFGSLFVVHVAEAMQTLLWTWLSLSHRAQVFAMCSIASAIVLGIWVLSANLLVFWPLLPSAILNLANLFLGRRFSKRWVFVISTIHIFASLFV